MIQVSHESPIALLEKSRLYNDYDYALVHLFETHPEYYKYFKRSLENGRKVYLDNSIFELGESFDPLLYLKWIHELQPTYYIIPDVLEDVVGTINKLHDWKRNTLSGPEEESDFEVIGGGSTTADLPLDFHEAYPPEGSPDPREVKEECVSIDHIKTIGVVQGRDWNELVGCYEIMAKEVDMIAISFDYTYYLHTGRGIMGAPDTDWYGIMYGNIEPPVVEDPMNCDVCRDKLHRYCTGRQRFIQQLIDEGIWDWSKPHHLLGCSLAKEFSYYSNSRTKVDNIVSIDTSNPVVAGLKRIRYNFELGLDSKPSSLLADMIDFNVSNDEWPSIERILYFNTDMFKKIIGR